ncbi:PREDICTED: zinc finger MYM-type protein 1-like [Rhagoletis zephyria]|uniref:zinc finger MYM-type protein 1-like n=1 Tax=Rhagoletis zephyria TaxID=28612 RepID=UPI00081151F5|nr:PREDICTED: zinc finger MYM-type protein 1-like [Rhagoletis zephyria]
MDKEKKKTSWGKLWTKKYPWIKKAKPVAPPLSSQSEAGTSSQSDAVTSSQSEAEVSNLSASAMQINEPTDAMETENYDENTDFTEMHETTSETTETHEEDSIPMDDSTIDTTEVISEFDLGLFMNKPLSSEQRSLLLKRCWVPPQDYDFAVDSDDSKRNFLHNWLQVYKPWLVYSKKEKGALCLHCVLFHKTTVQGFLGAFVVKSFTKYKDMHELSRNHARSKWHQTSMKAAIEFTTAKPVDLQMVTGHQKLIEENKKIIRSIISNIIFCGTTDSPLRGKDEDSGIFMDLIRLRIEAGDESLKKHFEEGPKNAKYTSPEIQNEIIALCGEVVKDMIIADAKKASAYSILADETADISGKEQLSLGIRFYDKSQAKIREEFMGFSELNAMDAPTIADEIDRAVYETLLAPSKT